MGKLPATPSILHTNRESREVALKHFTLIERHTLLDRGTSSFRNISETHGPWPQSGRRDITYPAGDFADYLTTVLHIKDSYNHPTPGGMPTNGWMAPPVNNFQGQRHTLAPALPAQNLISNANGWMPPPMNNFQGQGHTLAPAFPRQNRAETLDGLFSMPINRLQGQEHTVAPAGVQVSSSVGSPAIPANHPARSPGTLHTSGMAALTQPPRGSRFGSNHELDRLHEPRQPELFYTNFDIDSYILEAGETRAAREAGEAGEPAPVFPTFRLKQDLYQPEKTPRTLQNARNIIGMQFTRGFLIQ